MEAYVKHLFAELEAALDGASEDALQKAPAGRWNSAQILEHLYLTYWNTNKGIARCLDGGKPVPTRAATRQRLRQLVVIGFGYLPQGAKAPERAQPRGMASAEVREKIFGEIQKMDAGLDECEKRFGAGTKIMDHPILGPLTANEWRTFHQLHGRLHSRQIRERCNLK